MSQKEIAQQMQLSQSTVEKHIAKGLLNTMLYMRDEAHDENCQQSASIVRAVK
jgi:RNA polymerase sigma-70 factor (ECF subfamily)